MRKPTVLDLLFIALWVLIVVVGGFATRGA
jgi:hypothetical protein